MVQLLRERPNWLGALSVALARPPGVPERRHGHDPRKADPANHPSRATDDLAWLREAFEDPAAYGPGPWRPAAPSPRGSPTRPARRDSSA